MSILFSIYCIVELLICFIFYANLALHSRYSKSNFPSQNTSTLWAPIFITFAMHERKRYIYKFDLCGKQIIFRSLPNSEIPEESRNGQF